MQKADVLYCHRLHNIVQSSHALMGLSEMVRHQRQKVIVNGGRTLHPDGAEPTSPGQAHHSILDFEWQWAKPCASGAGVSRGEQG